MRRLLVCGFLWMTVVGAMGAQTCHYGQGQTGLAADLKDIRAAGSCKQAYVVYEKCLWGSSADPARAEPVAQKCEALFAGKLTAAQQAVMRDKMALCDAEADGRGGTLAMSEHATCRLGVTYAFAMDVARAAQPVPRASFDCALARSPLEMTICAHAELGRADLMLSRAYKPFFNAVKGVDRQALMASQRAWNKSVASTCGLVAANTPTSAIACLQRRYTVRAQTLSGCSTGINVGCVDSKE